SNADKGGLQEGDRIVAIDDHSISYFQELQVYLKESAGKKAEIEVSRGNESAGNKELAIEVAEDGTVGFYPEYLINFEQVEYGFGESVTKGTVNAFESLVLNIKGMGKVFTGEISTKSLKGPIGIAQIFGGTWDWE